MRTGGANVALTLDLTFMCSSSNVSMLFVDGPNQERREKEGAFSHQRGGDQRVHHQCPQAHPRSVSTAGTQGSGKQGLKMVYSVLYSDTVNGPR